MRGLTRKLWAFLERWLFRSPGSEQIHLPSAPTTSFATEASAEPLAADEASIFERSALRPIDSAGLARVFDAAHPVRTRSELFGRDVELTRLLETALNMRQHMIVHGSRGSGKTSLARVFGDYADQQGVVVIYLTCEDGATFADLMAPFLRALPASVLEPGETHSFRRRVEALPADFGPRAFAEMVGEAVTVPTILILDEFDRMQGDTVKADVSTAMKMLSDTLSEVLLMLVGIAETVDDIVDAHPSLRRHVQTVSLARIPPESVAALVERSAEMVGLPFSNAARELIARAACGSPYHVRLFCLHSSLNTVRNRARLVEPAHVLAGLRSAFLSWASMNEPDARAFLRVARADDVRKVAENIACEMAMFGTIAARPDARFVNAAELLGPALVADSKGRERVLFQDASAPQFLLAALMITENEGAEVFESLALESPHVLLD